MKKILVVLLVLAVAGGVFAQEGSWSVMGQVEIGSYIDFDNIPGPVGGVYTNDEPAMVTSSGYHAPYHYYDTTNGSFLIGYSLGGLGANLIFNTLDGVWSWSKFAGDVVYDGDNFKFQIKANLNQLIGEKDAATHGSNDKRTVERLWGSYELLNGMIHLEAAFNSRDISDSAYWTSNSVAGFYEEGQFFSPITNVFDKANDAMKGPKRAYSANSHGNFLLADIVLENLDFGVLIPNLFYNENVHPWNANYNKMWDMESYSTGDKDRYYQEHATFPRNLEGQGAKLLVADVLKNMVFGVKFEMQPIEFAAQFLVQDYSVYFGGKVGLGALTIGGSFMGVMVPTDEKGAKIDGNILRVGGSLGYDADAFGAGLDAWLGVLGSKDDYQNQIGVEPFFFYNVIPTHLRFKTSFGFYFNNTYADGKKNTEASSIVWALQPELFWNFLGTGAGEYWGIGTGMIVRYRMVKEANNALDISFKLSF